MLADIEATPKNLAIGCTLYLILMFVLYHIAKRAIWTYDGPPGSQASKGKSQDTGPSGPEPKEETFNMD